MGGLHQRSLTDLRQELVAHLGPKPGEIAPVVAAGAAPSFVEVYGVTKRSRFAPDVGDAEGGWEALKESFRSSARRCFRRSLNRLSVEGSPDEEVSVSLPFARGDELERHAKASTNR